MHKDIHYDTSLQQKTETNKLSNNRKSFEYGKMEKSTKGNTKWLEKGIKTISIHCMVESPGRNVK